MGIQFDADGRWPVAADRGAVVADELGGALDRRLDVGDAVHLAEPIDERCVHQTGLAGLVVGVQPGRAAHGDGGVTDALGDLGAEPGAHRVAERRASR